MLDGADPNGDWDAAKEMKQNVQKLKDKVRREQQSLENK